MGGNRALNKWSSHRAWRETGYDRPQSLLKV